MIDPAETIFLGLLYAALGTVLSAVMFCSIGGCMGANICCRLGDRWRIAPLRLGGGPSLLDENSGNGGGLESSFVGCNCISPVAGIR